MSLYERLSKARDVAPAGGGGGSVAELRIADPFAELKRGIHQALVAALGPKLYDKTMTAEQLEAHVRERLGDVLAGTETPLSQADRQRLSREIADDILGHGPIEPYLQDPSVTEVMVNGPYTVYIEREGKIVRTPAQFLDEAHLRHTIDKIVGRVGRASTKPPPTSTPACPTAAASTPPFRRSCWTVPC